MRGHPNETGITTCAAESGPNARSPDYGDQTPLLLPVADEVEATPSNSRTARRRDIHRQDVPQGKGSTKVSMPPSRPTAPRPAAQRLTASTLPAVPVVSTNAHNLSNSVAADPPTGSGDRATATSAVRAVADRSPDGVARRFFPPRHATDDAAPQPSRATPQPVRSPGDDQRASPRSRRRVLSPAAR